MSSQHFRLDEHKIEASHIRSFPRALSTHENDVLYLAVKQYTPLNNPIPQDGDVTIIAAHANAFPKELYEPLWDELLQRSQKFGFRIRSIWIADVVHQGHSSVLNEDKLGNDRKIPSTDIHSTQTYTSQHHGSITAATFCTWSTPSRAKCRVP